MDNRIYVVDEVLDNGLVRLEMTQIGGDEAEEQFLPIEVASEMFGVEEGQIHEGKAFIRFADGVTASADVTLGMRARAKVLYQQLLKREGQR